jgi:cell division protein FtsA
MLREILEPRAADLVELTADELTRSHLERQLGAGLVMVGGGAKLSGLVRMAEQALEVPVRIGQPNGLDNMGELLPDPAFATAVGLVLYGNRRRLLQGSIGTGWTDRLRQMFRSGGDN